MSFSYDISFSLIEWLALMGLTQTLLILVYILFRARSFSRAAPALAYFGALAAAFALQFALRLEDYEYIVRFALWCARMSGPPLCFLLVAQIAAQGKLPPARHFLVFALVPLACALALFTGSTLDICHDAQTLCTRQFDLLYCLGAMAGAVALLALFFSADIFQTLKTAKGGRERYWLSLSLAAANVLVVATALVRSYGGIKVADADALMLLYSFAFAYLATTALFRVYPLPVEMSDKPRSAAPALSASESDLAARITTLMNDNKLYQEPAFSRADLARALGTSESILSRVINAAFGKSFPRLLNTLRVEEAQRLLQDAALPIQDVASESGFNSLASFNRVFRDLTGETPSSFRARIKKDL